MLIIILIITRVVIKLNDEVLKVLIVWMFIIVSVFIEDQMNPMRLFQRFLGN